MIAALGTMNLVMTLGTCKYGGHWRLENTQASRAWFSDSWHFSEGKGKYRGLIIAELGMNLVMNGVTYKYMGDRKTLTHSI